MQELEKGLPDETKERRSRKTHANIHTHSNSSTTPSARAANSASSSYANGMSKDRYNVRPKKKLSWDPRPPHVYIVTYSLDELASRKAHWRQIESEASRMAQSAGSNMWSDGNNDAHPNTSSRNYAVD
eukprot:CAMPEP_0173118300 /NCGR_PEP_ID=MMETSP1102-20130122/50895_1 /TAXON_ID=49646 /ORGANISM="Geminigera sp., Strain Caron Lab Isolate" /LENGTH=127 /DNA_ID=CAMNT_0014023263 /DNA_START=75 /DNA_END=458 /DNA_ORIENTATION=-